MKIRRVTLAVLALLTLLFIADVRYFGGGMTSIQEPSIHFNAGPNFRNAVEKKEVFNQPQGGFTTLVVKGQQGTTILRSIDGNEIKVTATIAAESQSVLDRHDVKESISGSELSYELTREGSEGSEGSEGIDAGVSFLVEVPAGMEVGLEQSFGTVGVRDFVGFLKVNSSFSDVNVWGLEGTAEIQSSFGDVDLREIAGPITLNNSFATSTIGLLAIDEGYDFDIEVINGSLKHNAGFQLDLAENRVSAQEKWGEGVHPIVIRSSFSTVTVHLDK